VGVHEHAGAGSGQHDVRADGEAAPQLDLEERASQLDPVRVPKRGRAHGRHDRLRRMIRRDFFKTPLALAGLRLAPPEPQAEGGREELAQAPGLTRSVAEFIVNTTYEDIPDDVIALGSKTLLDGFG